MMTLANEYFPYSEIPELFLMFRLMITIMPARQLYKNAAIFAADIETLVTRRPDQPTTEALFYPIFGKRNHFLKFFIFYLGNLTKDLPQTLIQFNAISYLRRNLIKLWYDAVQIVKLSCKDIKQRKYYRSNEVLASCPLNIDLMPLPTTMVVYPKLR